MTNFNMIPETATASDAKFLSIRLGQLNTLLDNVLDNEDATSDAKDIAIKTVSEIEAALKQPKKSSKFRAAAVEAEKAVEAAKLTKGMRIELEAERKLVKAQLRAIAKGGNAFAVKSAKLWEDRRRKTEKVKKMKRLDINIRLAPLADSKAKRKSFQLFSFEYDVILRQYMPLIEKMAAYKYDKRKDKLELAEELTASRKAAAEFVDLLKETASQPITVSQKEGRTIRLGESVLSDAFGIDLEDKHPTDAWIVVHHMVQEVMNQIEWRVFSSRKEDGLKRRDDLQKNLYRHLGMRGVMVLMEDGNHILYKGLVASASHQKSEKLVMADEKLMKKHERVIYGGRTEEEALKLAVDGAAWWKMRANMARPIIKELRTIDGEPVYLHDGISVPDVEKAYNHDNAMLVGGEKVCQRGKMDNPVILCDGAIFYLVQMENDANQTTGFGLKGMGVYVKSVIDFVLHKHNLNEIVTLPDGRSIVGKKFIFGEGCWKFDKLGYANFDEYAKAMDELAVEYPGINQVYVLREADEVEGEDKKRRLSRSLEQQFIDIARHEVETLTANTVKKLQQMKHIDEMWTSMAQLNKPEEERNAYAKLFGALPTLCLNQNVQAIWQKRWEAIKLEGQGDYLLTKGQYPYIMQDPVAALECWLFGKNPDDPTIGLLKDGEASINAVPEDRVVGAVRFPANALTAKTLICKPYADVYASCGNVCILSIYDDILIMQDGDVDGDEMFILYDQLVIKLIERMRANFKPPVIVFAHGAKGKKVAPETEGKLVMSMYDSLWAAKRYDQVGKYANLARSCAYLATIAHYTMVRTDNEALCEQFRTQRRQWLTYMSLASTGAILAIDQVKGNAVDPKLIKKLEEISDEVAQCMDRKHPYTQQFLKKGIMAEKCLEADERVGTDLISIMVRDGAGKFEMDQSGLVDNKAALAAALFKRGVLTTTVRQAPVITGVVKELRKNYFNDCPKDQEIFNLIRAGKPIGQKDLLQLYWRNACALAFRMDGKTVNEKKDDYYRMVRESLIAQALSQPWVGEKGVNAGHVFTDEEKIASVIKSAVTDALELGARGNGLEDENKASYAKFVLSVFAEDLLNNVLENGYRMEDFMEGLGNPDTLKCVDGYEDTIVVEETEEPEDSYAISEEEMAYALSLVDDVWFGDEVETEV